MVVRRVISKQGMVSHVEIDIRSPLLQDLFRDLFKNVEGLDLNKTPPMVRQLIRTFEAPLTDEPL